MNNKEKCLLGVTCFLGGVVTGFLISPIKKGMYFGNNCGNTVQSGEDIKEMSKMFNEDDRQE